VAFELAMAVIKRPKVAFELAMVVKKRPKVAFELAMVVKKRTLVIFTEGGLVIKFSFAGISLEALSEVVFGVLYYTNFSNFFAIKTVFFGTATILFPMEIGGWLEYN